MPAGSLRSCSSWWRRVARGCENDGSLGRPGTTSGLSNLDRQDRSVARCRARILRLVCTTNCALPLAEPKGWRSPDQAVAGASHFARPGAAGSAALRPRDRPHPGSPAAFRPPGRRTTRRAKRVSFQLQIVKEQLARVSHLDRVERSITVAVPVRTRSSQTFPAQTKESRGGTGSGTTGTGRTNPTRARGSGYQLPRLSRRGIALSPKGMLRTRSISCCKRMFRSSCLASCRNCPKAGLTSSRS